MPERLETEYLGVLEENASLHIKLAIAEKRISELEAEPRVEYLSPFCLNCDENKARERASILQKGLEYYALMGSNPAKDALRAAADVRQRYTDALVKLSNP